jgi:hypothetical protein
MGENAPKIVIVVLVIVAVVFFVGIGVGAGGGNSGQGGLPGISVDSAVNAFSGLFPAPAVALGDITNVSPAACSIDSTTTPPSIVISTAQICRLNVKNSDANIRALKLKLADNQSIHIESTSDPVEDKPMLTKLDLPSKGSSQVTLNFFQKNGGVTISQCAPGGESVCTLTIVS